MFFKKAKRCEHDYGVADKYYNHELTEYVNGSDSIELVTVLICKKCLDIKERTIDKKYFPVNNDSSYTLKRQYIELLESEGVKTKQRYLLSVLK